VFLSTASGNEGVDRSGSPHYDGAKLRTSSGEGVKQMRVFALMAALLIAAPAEADPQPFKIGYILDMSGPYADITGKGSVEAARMAAEDFGGSVLGRPIEIVFADHLNKADIASNTAREWFDTRGVEAILDVAASATALAANEIAKARNKIIVFNGPGSVRLTNEACGPYSVHYTFDTYAMSRGTALAMVKKGYDSWFFITADYAFGHDLEKDASTVVTANGGKVLGSARVPLNTPDFSSFILQAQASKAKVIGLANAGADTINSVKQASDFGLAKSGQKLAGLLVFLTDVDSLGLPIAQGMLLTEAFYWDMDDETRAWSQRFFARMQKMPTMAQAGVYSSTMHYLKAVAAAGTTDAEPVMKRMKETPINDMFVKGGKIREDGRMMRDMYLFEVKSPAESKARWDDYKLVATIPASEAFQPLALSRCPLVKK
jgi:branched-chain amino acid transport system substrate-binding protein